MAVETAPGRAAEIREVRRSLAGARDEQIARVVAMVDALADRGSADGIIAPLRPRLAQLRPARKLRLTRLLFVPLDPLIVSPRRWRPGEPTVPRSALTPLADAVRERAGPCAAAVEKLIDGHAQDEAVLIDEAGSMLWREAARVLPGSAAPRSWADTGLPQAEYGPLARGVAGALQHAASVRRIVAEERHGLVIARERIETILGEAAAAGAEAWSMTTALLLNQLLDPSLALHWLEAGPAPSPDPASWQRNLRVLEAALDDLDAPDGNLAKLGADFAGSGAELRRAVALLASLDVPAAPSPVRKRLDEIRRSVDARSVARFEHGMTDQLLAPLRDRLPSAEPLDVDALEATARELRCFELAGRRLGSASRYDAVLRRAAGEVKGLGPQIGMTIVDKVRLLEILVGADEALTLLAGGKTAA